MGNKLAKCDGFVNPVHDLNSAKPSTTAYDGAKMSPTEESRMPPTANIDMTSRYAKLFEYNPGTVDDFHKKCKEVFPICFDGGKFMVQKGLSNHFQISHTVSLSPTLTGYRFGATYVGSSMFGPQEAFPVLLGDTDLSGNLTATAIHQLNDRLRLKAAAQIQKGKFAGAQLTTDYRFLAATASMTIANLDLVNESGIVVGSYLRKITKSIDLGIELVYQYSRQIPGGQLSNLSYLGKYTGRNFVTSAAVGKNQLHFCYYHKQDENVQFGVEWETNFRMGDSTATFGYQLDIPKTGVTFKASIDTNWTVGSTLEKKLTPLPFTLALSGMLNHVKHQSRFGVGLILG
uniref:Uncharacterized protein n=1 Tax=Romanomermis culicivorax TaxID=13658 RepID=A0A915KK25_ROMCU